MYRWSEQIMMGVMVQWAWRTTNTGVPLSAFTPKFSFCIWVSCCQASFLHMAGEKATGSSQGYIFSLRIRWAERDDL